MFATLYDDWHASGDEDGSLHPAVIKAELLVSELEESRMLREKDKLRYEVMLQEAERDKGKLLRQVLNSDGAHWIGVQK